MRSSSARWLVSAPCCWSAVLVLVGPQGVGYNGLFAADSFSRFVKLLLLVASAMGVVVSLDYNEHQNLRRFEFPVLIVLCTVGMMIMASATNLMTLYLGLEMHSLALYVLAAFARDQLRSAEAGLKYFVLGALASRAAALRCHLGLRLHRLDGFRGTRLCAVRPVARFTRADGRDRVHRGGPRLQGVRRAVPYVDAGRLRGRADAGHAVPRHRAEGGSDGAAGAGHGDAVRPHAGPVAATHRAGGDRVPCCSAPLPRSASATSSG